MLHERSMIPWIHYLGEVVELEWLSLKPDRKLDLALNHLGPEPGAIKSTIMEKKGYSAGCGDLSPTAKFS